MNTRIRIVVVEDEPLIAEDIRDTLTNIDYEVVAVVHTLEDAIEALEITNPDLALLDINLGDNLDGITIAEAINKKFFIPFLYLTSYSSKQIIEKVKHTKPMGYIVKPFNEGELFTNIEIAIYNHAQRNKPTYFTRDYLNQNLQADITEKEFQILQDLYEGSTNKQLAEKHFLSVNTIKSHLKNIYLKLNCHSRTEVIKLLRTKLG